MNQFPNDDEKLVAFVRQNRPVPPPAAANFEEQLLEGIDRQPIPSQQPRHRVFWAIPSAVAAGLLLAWGGYRLLNPATNTAELEVFLVNSWNGAIGETSLTSQTESPEADWLLLSDLETDSLSSNP